MIDKITILEIKSERIVDPAKLRNVTHELTLLRRLRGESGFHGCELDALGAKLKTANLALWEIEDEIRLCEQRGDFGERFIALARSVYKTNDERGGAGSAASILLCGSAIVEEKSYAGGAAPA